MAEVNLGNLEYNAHLVLYYLVSVFPEMKDKKELSKVTGLHYNTIGSKTRTLVQMNLIEEKRSGRTPYFFVSSNVKELFDKWAATSIGKKMVEDFKSKLGSQK
ncbi:MAG: hypothetical protein ACXAEU_05580 [Candidatus Hodarchaeales archaeon]|jgi:hypothetical protein